MVVQLNFEAHGHHVGGHFRADIHQGILWSSWEVTMLMLNLVAKVVAIVAAGGPRGFYGVDFVECAAWVGCIADTVKDEEFGSGPKKPCHQCQKQRGNRGLYGRWSADRDRNVDRCVARKCRRRNRWWIVRGTGR